MSDEKIILQLEKILESLESTADNCKNGILRIEEVQDVISKTRQKLQEILPKDSIPFRIFDRMKNEKSMWFEATTSGYANKDHCEKVDHWINIVQEVINKYDPEFLQHKNKDQYFLLDNDVYSAQKLVFKIMKKAKNSLIIVDQYLDEEIFDYIDSLDNSIDIKMLTGDQKSMFRKLYLNNKRTNIEAKENKQCHDRFLVVDGKEIWQLGASINGIGKKACMVNKIVDINESNKFLNNYQDWWARGLAIN